MTSTRVKITVMSLLTCAMLAGAIISGLHG